MKTHQPPVPSKAQSRKPKALTPLKSNKPSWNPYAVGAYAEPIAGEQDQDYLPLKLPGQVPLLDFGRPGW